MPRPGPKSVDASVTPGGEHLNGKGGEVKYISEEFLAGLVIFLAAAVRLLHVIFTARLNPLAESLTLDSMIYDTWAKAVVWGGELPTTKLMQAPLYPWFVSLVYRLFGPSLTAVRSVQAVLGVMTCGFITVTTRRLMGSSTAGIAAGLLAALYLPAIFYEGLILPVSLILFLNALFILMMVPDSGSPGPARMMAAGFVLGLSVMTKAVALLLLPFALIYVAWGARTVRRAAEQVTGEGSGGALGNSGRLRLAGALVIGVIFAMAPLAFRNARMTGSFTPLTTGGGINLYIGNNPRANGFYSVPVYGGKSLGGTPEVQHERMTAIAESEAGRRLSPPEVSAFWVKEGLRYIASEPGAAAALAWRKFIYFFNRYERASVESMQFHRRFGGILALPLPGYWLVLSLAVLGAVLTRKDWRRLILLYGGVLTYLATAVIFYVLARYRVPVVVFMLPFAGAAVMLLLKMIRDRKTFDLFIMAVSLVLIFYATGLKVARDTPLGTATRLVRLGKVYANSGEIGKAEKAWREALEIDPGHPEAERCLRESGLTPPGGVNR